MKIHRLFVTALLALVLVTTPAESFQRESRTEDGGPPHYPASSQTIGFTVPAVTALSAIITDYIDTGRTPSLYGGVTLCFVDVPQGLQYPGLLIPARTLPGGSAF